MNVSPILAMELSVGISAWLLFPVLITLGWLWATQFIQLMLMSEYDFPGRTDKLIWGAAFVVLFVFAPFAFWGWKEAYLDGIELRKNAKKEDPILKPTEVPT